MEANHAIIITMVMVIKLKFKEVALKIKVKKVVILDYLDSSICSLAILFVLLLPRISVLNLHHSLL